MKELLCLIACIVFTLCNPKRPDMKTIREGLDVVDTSNIGSLSDTLIPPSIGNDSNKADDSSVSVDEKMNN